MQELFPLVISLAMLAFVVYGVVLMIRGSKPDPVLGPRVEERDWRRGVIKPNRPGLAKQGWWSIVGVAAMVVMGFTSDAPKVLLIGLGVLFAAPVVRAAYFTVQYFSHSKSTLLSRPLPVPLGTEFKGEIVTTLRRKPDAAIIVELLCYRWWITRESAARAGSVDHSRVTLSHQEVLWNAKQSIEPGALREVQGRVRVPFSFTVPADVKPTDRREWSDQILWELNAYADVPGVDYRVFFLVPVSQAHHSPDSSPAA